MWDWAMVPSGRPLCDPTVAIASGWIVEAEKKKKDKVKDTRRRSAKDKDKEKDIPEPEEATKYYCKCLQVPLFSYYHPKLFL